MSQQIPTLDLTGATTNQQGAVSWLPQEITSILANASGTGRPHLELVNMSACMLIITIPGTGDVMPLPPGTWRPFPLDSQSNSYSYTVLNAQQNATQNKVYGFYYAASEGAPSTGQVVNQSQALAAAAQPLSGVLNISGGSGAAIVTLGPSTTASSFSLYAVTLSFYTFNAASLGGIGRPVQLIVKQHTPNNTVWQANVQESLAAFHFVLNLVIPNTTPGSTSITVEADPVSFFSPVFSYAGSLAYIASSI